MWGNLLRVSETRILRRIQQSTFFFFAHAQETRAQPAHNQLAELDPCITFDETEVAANRRSPSRASLLSGSRLSATMAQFTRIMIAEANDANLDQQFATIMMREDDF